MGPSMRQPGCVISHADQKTRASVTDQSPHIVGEDDGWYEYLMQ